MNSVRDDSHPAIGESLLNPALTAAVITWSAKRYQLRRKEAMPFAIAFLVTPMVLHRRTRESLPKTTGTHLVKWVNDNQELVAGLGPRARQFMPHVRQGIRYGVRYGSIVLSDNGGMVGKLPAEVVLEEGSESREILSTAGLLGAWFAKQRSTAHVFGTLGLEP